MCTNVNYCCINDGTTGYSGQYNITTDPCFVDDVNANDYHLKFGSLCRNAGDPNRTYDSNETDIDGQPRRNGIGQVDIGADEFYNSTNLNGDGQVNFLDYAIFANAWKTRQGVAKWNAACDLIDNNNVDINDLAWFVQDWYFPPADQQSHMDGMEGMGEEEQQTEPEALVTGPSEEPPMIVEEPQPPEASATESSEEPPMMEESELPTVYMTCDNNMPEPNQEVTVYVHSDTPLYVIEVVATITGDVNVTAALNPDDCNQYGWDPSWEFGPGLDLDTFGFVYFVGLSWPDESSSGVVGYLKFIYHGGQVVVSIADGGSTIDTNWESVPFSTDTLIFGIDPNE